MTLAALRPDGLLDPAPRAVSRVGSWVGCLIVTGAVGAAYSSYAVWQWTQFTVKSWDLGIFTQLLQSYARWDAPIVPIKGDGFNLLGDHFHPLLALLAPVYALLPSALTLLIIQALCFAVAAGILTRVATRILGSIAGGMLVGGAFGLSWGLQYAAEAQFHEIALAVPLLAASLGALLERRWTAAALWAAPLVFVKEDLGLTVLVIGLLIAYQSRRVFGVWLAVWGLGWFALATLVVLPLVNPQGTWAYAANANPVAVLADPAGLFSPSKGYTLLLLAAITGGLVVRSPVALVLLPTLAWRFLSSNHGYWGPTWHYSAVLMPIAFIAMLDAIQRGPQARWRWVRAYSRHGVAVAVTVSVMLLPTLPLWTLLAPSAWQQPARADAATAVLDAVPAGASVETDIGLMSYLVGGHPVFWIGNSNPPPTCVVIDRVAGGLPADWGGAVDVATRLHPGGRYVSLLCEEGYELACAVRARAP